VTNILESSDAYRRGLRYDDEIVEFAGRPMRTVNAFKNALGIFPKGWRVPLTYRRDGVTHDVVVRLAGVHRSRELWALASRTPPKPDEKPGDDKPDKKDPNDTPPGDEEPEKKPRLPKLPELPEFPFDLKKKPKDPQVITDHYEVRPGFANYYYNRHHLDRVWKGFAGHGDFSALLGNWTLGGQSLQGGDVQFQIDEQRGVAILPAGQSTVDFTSQFGRDLKPLGSGGLLTALACWRRMLLVGPQRYGKVEYVGTAPLAGSMLTVDVVSATNEGVESHFLFDPDEGQLVGLEMFPASDVDPCEIYFADYREVDGRRLPHELEVRHGDLVFGRYKLNYFDLAEKGQP